MKSKTKKTKQIIKKEEVKERAPTIPIDSIDVNFSAEELSMLTNLLSISASVFQAMAMQAAEANQEEKFSLLSRRYSMLVSYATKLANASLIGEPISREIH
jgi:hypothetical protein